MRPLIPLAPLAALAFALPAQAALPPWHQRAAELRAVADHGGLIEALGGNAMIERIEYVRPDLYRVSAGRCQVDARIHDLPVPRGVVGGRRFEVRLGRRVCR
ncbi:MAG TPA: hypothetical protein VMG08_12380 [Allosphingosinicella sp.]|nr:hypothetical protein [Allosphingosinicella sp.]